MMPKNADYWFVAFALFIVICVASYGASCTGFKTGTSVFSHFEAMTTEPDTQTDSAVIAATIAENTPPVQPSTPSVQQVNKTDSSPLVAPKDVIGEPVVYPVNRLTISASVPDIFKPQPGVYKV